MKGIRGIRQPKPVENIPVSEKHLGKRVAAFLACLAVALGALTYTVYEWLSTDPGWVQVEVTANETHCGGEFTLNYLLRGDRSSATAELRAVRSAYNELAVRAYRLFTPAESFDDPEDVGVTHNLWYINAHPNEEILVDEALYQAFQQLEDQRSRAAYLGPVYSVYQDLFFCQDDVSARQVDPLEEEETRAFCGELAAFAADSRHIQVELLGENRLRLRVSEEYQAYARQVERANYLDFGWMRTAFMADYMAGELAGRGLDSGLLTSYDGCSRVLGQPIGEQNLSVYGWTGERAVMSARTVLDRPVNGVSLRTFPLNELDSQRCYVYQDGGLRHGYIDSSDGLCRSAADSLTLYGEELGCGELALRAEKLFVADRLDRDRMLALHREGVEAVAVEENSVLVTEEALPWMDIYAQGEEVYKIVYIGE